jgi:methionyl-tRNA synthetase
MVEKFGIDGTRYLLLSFGNFGEDIDINWERLTEKFNADLANGLGNLVSRVIKLSEDLRIAPNEKFSLRPEFSNWIDKMELGHALNHIWHIISEANKFIEDNKPWELKKSDEKKFQEVMQKLVNDLNIISELLNSFMPETAGKIKQALDTKKTNILFQRLNTK